MNYEQLMSIIGESPYSEELWCSSYVRDKSTDDNSAHVFTLKSDLDIRIVTYGAGEQFDEAWANGFHDRKAYTVDYEVWYGASLVESSFLVAVDNMRAYLPLPRDGTSTVTHHRYLVAQAVDEQGTLNEYMRRVNFTVDLTVE